jgi:hypothetical protein
MQRRKTATVTMCLLGGVLASLVSLSPAQTAHNQNVLLVRGARILPINGPAIAQGVLVIQGGKISAVSETVKVSIPPGAKIQDAAGKVIVPGNKAVAAKDKTAKEPDHDLALDAVVQVLDGKRRCANDSA